MSGGFLRTLDATNDEKEIKKGIDKSNSEDEYRGSDNADNQRRKSYVNEDEEQEIEDATEQNSHAQIEHDDDSDRNEADDERKASRWDKLKIVKQKNKELEQQNNELYNKLIELDSNYKNIYDNNVYNYGNSAAVNLDLATKSYKEAMENGSVDDIAKATADYTFALNEFQNASRIVKDNASYNERRFNQVESNPQANDNRSNEYLQREWLQENPEIDSNSRYYDANLTKKIIKEANKLNEYLESKGAAHIIGSRDYLDKLDEYIEYYSNKSPSNNLQGYAVHSQNNTREKNHNYNLTEVEKKIAAAQNMTAKEYRDSQARMPESLRLKQQMLKG